MLISYIYHLSIIRLWISKMRLRYILPIGNEWSGYIKGFQCLSLQPRSLHRTQVSYFPFDLMQPLFYSNNCNVRHLTLTPLYPTLPRYVTSVQGDGLIISTPTGSTAYAAAAGASMCHPCVPAIVIAPICAHSLSFRPVMVPAGVEIKVVIVIRIHTNYCTYVFRDVREVLLSCLWVRVHLLFATLAMTLWISLHSTLTCR